MSDPCISVIIAAKNAERTIALCLDSVSRLDYPYYEVIVVDDGSEDQTGRIAADHAGVKVFRMNGEGPSVARNRAVMQAHGDFVAFTDADCVVSQDWIKELLKGFVDETVAGVGGIQKSPADEVPFARKVQQLLQAFGFMTNYMQTARALREVNHNASCNVMYRRSVYDAFCGFLEDFWPGEDLELDHRIRQKKWKLMMNPKAVVYHYRTQTVQGFSRMMFRYGWAQGKLVRMHGAFRPVQWLPLVTFLGLFGLFFFPVPSLIAMALLATGTLFRLSFDATKVFLSIVAFIQWHFGFLKGIISPSQNE